ncbi:MAG: glycoside hydrolase [Chloroflexi bacterium]|nr:MAG: glycoside hydrolase [Chloroflexota bacterium]
MPPCHLAIHGHFYQPPRTDPFTGRIPREPGAAPYANWNERITAECYAPNAEAGNFERLSFNLGGTLARWLDERAHATYESIVAAEQNYRKAHVAGNGVAQPVHHTILPLARRRDKICQIRWGIASFKHRFGHEPLGMWLPEMAVDYETLEILAAEGLRFTILSDEQVRGDLTIGGGPYRVRLPGGGEIADLAVFVRDRHLSNALSFGMPDPSRADDWLRDQVGWRCREGQLLLIATDGETFGHHHRQGIETLSRILSAGDAHGYEPTTLGHYLRQNPPQAELEIIEYTAWSCGHRLDRWVIGCGCTPGDSRWKSALRRALDNLACDLDQVYVCETQKLGLEPWPLRDSYIALVLGQVDGPTLLSENGLNHLRQAEQNRLLWLLESQFHRQRMYASCAFFFEDLARLEPRYAIANGIRALALTLYATGDDLSHSFRRDLGVAVSARTGRTGADMFDTMLAQAEA